MIVKYLDIIDRTSLCRLSPGDLYKRDNLAVIYYIVIAAGDDLQEAISVVLAETLREFQLHFQEASRRISLTDSTRCSETGFSNLIRPNQKMFMPRSGEEEIPAAELAPLMIIDGKGPLQIVSDIQ